METVLVFEKTNKNKCEFIKTPSTKYQSVFYCLLFSFLGGKKGRYKSSYPNDVIEFYMTLIFQKTTTEDSFQLFSIQTKSKAAVRIFVVFVGAVNCGSCKQANVSDPDYDRGC